MYPDLLNPEQQQQLGLACDTVQSINSRADGGGGGVSALGSRWATCKVRQACALVRLHTHTGRM
jgi:hypothetical protein